MCVYKCIYIYTHIPYARTQRETSTRSPDDLEAELLGQMWGVWFKASLAGIGAFNVGLPQKLGPRF